MRRLAVPLLTMMLMPAASGPAADAASSSAVRVSGASPYAADCFDIEQGGFGTGFLDAETEVTLAVDPRRPTHLIAGWMQDLYNGYVTATSVDGGQTWSGPVVVPGISACSGGDADLGVDPWVSIGADGTAYIAGFSLDLPDATVPAPVRSRLQVSTSRDLGRHWSQPHVITDDPVVLNDKPAVTADPKKAGRAYLVWTRHSTAFGPLSTGISFTRTEDGGTTWNAARTVLAPDPPTLIPHGSELLVLPDGSLLVVATMLPGLVPDTGRWLPHTVQAVRSTDGGQSWSSPVTVAEFTTGDGGFHSGADPDSGDRLQAPSAFTGVDVAPDGTVYLVWRHALSERQNELRLAHSSDGGTTWSVPRVVTRPRAATFLPHLAVAGDRTIGISYHDTRRDVVGDDTFTGDVWLARSRDGGRTWTEESLAGPMNLRRAPMREIPQAGRFLGDYHGFVGLPQGFLAALALPAPAAEVGATDVFAIRRSSFPSHRPATSIKRPMSSNGGAAERLPATGVTGSAVLLGLAIMLGLGSVVRLRRKSSTLG